MTTWRTILYTSIPWAIVVAALAFLLRERDRTVRNYEMAAHIANLRAQAYLNDIGDLNAELEAGREKRKALDAEYEILAAALERAQAYSHEIKDRPRPATAAELRASMLRSVGR